MEVGSAKTCRDCGETKPREEFPRKTGWNCSPGARVSRCRPCHNRRALIKKRTKHGIPLDAPKRLAQSPFRKRKAPPSEEEKKRREELNRTRARERYWAQQSLVYPTDKVFIDGRWRLSPEEKARRAALQKERPMSYPQFLAYVSGRKMETNISREEYQKLRAKVCHYCQGALPRYGCGMDRIDNSRGYLLENVVPCCTECNLGRGDRYTHEEWVVMIKARLELQLKKDTSVEGNQPQRIIS